MDTILEFTKKYKSYIFLALIVLLALKVFIPQLDQLVNSIAELKNADQAWVVAGLLVFFLGIPIVTVQFMALAIKKIHFGLTFRVQMAGLFVSKLLPSSLGTITLNMYYLMQKKHSLAQATTVMTMNGITSGIAYGFLMLVAFASSDFTLTTIFSDLDIPKKAIAIVITLLAVALFLLFRVESIRGKISGAWQPLVQNLASFKKRPKAVIIGILTNGLGSFTSLFALYASAHALGVDISLASAMLAYTFGNIAAGLVPTPGGLGAAEAGIYAGLVVAGVDEASAISITMLYRLISYWIPILPGYYFFWDLRKSVLSRFSLNKNYNTETDSRAVE